MAINGQAAVTGDLRKIAAYATLLQWWRELLHAKAGGTLGLRALNVEKDAREGAPSLDVHGHERMQLSIIVSRGLTWNPSQVPIYIQRLTASAPVSHRQSEEAIPLIGHAKLGQRPINVAQPLTPLRSVTTRRIKDAPRC